ncbi:MAG TPA: sensor histidine kinase [Solirubrobacteraceae bacterium]|nr:sensor histidine kinase [Solirubrobacteraceae bacterium]
MSAARRALPQWAIDWAPVVVLPPVFALDAVISANGKQLTPLNIICAVVVCVPLAFRHRLAIAPMVGLVIAGVLLVMWQLHPGNTVALLPMVAVYELARRYNRRRALQIAVICVPGVLAGVLPFADGFEHTLDLIARNLILCLGAVAAGDSVRARREASERAADLREQETLRRFTDERLRIAHEIHDVVAHGMTAINVQAGVAAHLLERDPDQAHRALRDIKRVSGEALTELRSTLAALRDPSESAPLAPTGGLRDLDRLLDGVRGAGMAIELDVQDVDAVPAAVDHASYRIVQEAVTNIARHSGATHARISVARHDGTLFLEIADDGRGVGSGTGDPPGNGLQGMRERARALGGTLEAGDGPSGGFTVRARMPVPDSAMAP